MSQEFPAYEDYRNEPKVALPKLNALAERLKAQRGAQKLSLFWDYSIEQHEGVSRFVLAIRSQEDYGYSKEGNPDKKFEAISMRQWSNVVVSTDLFLETAEAMVNEVEKLCSSLESFDALRVQFFSNLA